MGDRSPKDKQREKQQKDGAKAQDAAKAKSKQDKQATAAVKPKK